MPVQIARDVREFGRPWRADRRGERGAWWVVLDVLVAYLSAVIAIGPSDHTASVFGGGVVERVCAVVWFVAIAGRRFAPGWALWAGAGATVTAAASGAEVTNVSLASALALALVVRSRPPRRALELAGFPVAGALLALAPDDRAFVPAAVAHGVAWLAGRAGRTRDEVTETLRARDGERALTAERARMARELHDAVGHAVTIMLTHAGAARLTLADGSPPVREALTHIEEAGRAAMTDLDRILGLLTESYDVEAEIHNLTARLPADVPAELRLPSDGELRGLPSPVAEAVGRVVQESLTNVVRHARPARVVVEVGTGEGRVVVRVTDDGGARGGAGVSRGAGPDAGAGGGTRAARQGSRGGRGLAAMRERVAGLGGWVEAGMVEEGRGWRVVAVVPVPTESRGAAPAPTARGHHGRLDPGRGDSPHSDKPPP
ncbi:sensor histidine kinase [Streptomyces acidiscabies]|uniref:sensor histidine kinase n=1 Tax=Streptomyces acidiscabies TaxID=42234 RepID=UPI0038F795DA